MMYGYYGPGMGWWMALSSLFWLALVAVAVWALVRFVSQRTNSNARHDMTNLSSGSSAEEILRQRYARGEIDADTFQRMRAELESTPDRYPALPGSQL
jgi:putative membrane protein